MVVYFLCNFEELSIQEIGLDVFTMWSYVRPYAY